MGRKRKITAPSNASVAPMNQDELAMMCGVLVQALVFGTKMKNMKSAAEKRKIPHGTLDRWIDENTARVEKYRDDIEAEIKKTQWGPMFDLPGIGPGITARIVAGCIDIGRFPTANHFTSYCGLIPGKIRTRGKTQDGKKNPSNMFCATAKDGFIQLANIRIRQAGKKNDTKFQAYRKLFDEYKDRKAAAIEQLHKTTGKGGWKAHLNRMAPRRLAKVSALEVYQACKS